MVVSLKRATGLFMGVLLLLLPACFVTAQKPVAYSLAQLVDSAGHNLPLLLQKEALVRSAEAGIKEAGHAYLPKVNVVEELSVGSANDLTGPFLPVPGTLHSIAGSINSESNYQAVSGNLASVYAEYELVNFGLRGAKVASARAFAGVQQADLEKERYLVKWQLGRLYFEILRTAALLAVDSQDIARYQAMYSISLALTRTGVNAGVDSSLARAGLSRTQVAYNEAAGQLRKLKLQLEYLTGIVQPEIAMDTSGIEKRIVGAAGTGSMAGAGPGTGNGSGAGSGLTAGDKSAPGAGMGSSGQGTGIPANPLSDYFVRQRLLFGADERLARKSYLPKIVVGAGGWARGSSIQYSNRYESLGEGLGYQRLNYLAGVGVTYDLFNGIHRRDRLAVLDRQVEAADYALRQQQLSLHTQQLQAEESIRTAQETLGQLPLQLSAATDAYQQKLAKYKAGMINLVDLSNASFELFQAQSAYITAWSQWYTSSLDKAAASGDLESFIQTVK